MDKKVAQADPAAIKEAVTVFNDRLFKQMRVFLSKEASTACASNTTAPPAFTATTQTPFSRRPDEFNSSKRHSLTSNVSILDAVGRCALLSATPLAPGSHYSADFDFNQTRRWENVLANPCNESGRVILPDRASTNPKDDFLAEEFSGKFESDSEQQAERTIDLPRDVRGGTLSFLDYAQSAATTFEGSSLFSLKSLLERLENRNLCFRRYECDQCHRKFYNPAALGGHKSKQHPKSSKRYNDRKNTYSLRTGERRKRTFLNNL